VSYLVLPKRVFNSPLIRYANFKDGSHVNLIRLIKPYANGHSYAVHETTKSPFCSNGLFKTYGKAKEKFDLMVKNAKSVSELIKEEAVSNNMKYNHAFDFAYEVATDIEDPDKIDPEVLRAACIKRMQTMDAKEIHEACECFDTLNVEEDQGKV